MALPDLQGALWAWVQTLPPWQSDLLRRLAAIEQVSENDIAEAMRMVLAQFGLDDGNAPAPAPIPALIAPASHRVTQILALKDLVAVGSIEVNQRLDFTPEGLTIVFGETGSGKSSYARVLRKACRASARPIEILPNVLKSGPGTGQSRAGTAQIEVAVDGAASLIKRDVNAPPDPQLAEVSVFDSDCAAVYADGESEVTYTPSSLRLLERLVSFQSVLRKRIEDEDAAFNATGALTEGFNLSTKAGALVAALNENVNPDTVRALATLTSDELTRLNQVRGQVAAARASDPVLAATQLEKRAAAVDDLAAALDRYTARIGEDIVGELLGLNVKEKEVSAASERLSEALSKTTAMPVGNSAWKGLWAAAHAYVTSLAAEHAAGFPPRAADKEAHCPLCQQLLTEEAIQRLDSLEEHFHGQVENALDRVRVARKRLLADISQVLNDARTSATQIGALLGDEPVIESAVAAFLESARNRAEAIQETASANQIAAPSLASEPITALRRLGSELRRTASERRTLGNPDAVVRAVQEIAELENRQLLSQRIDAVLARIATLKRVARLRKAFSGLATTGVSKKIGEFTETAVTEQLRARLTTELKALGASHIPISIGARGSKGKTKVSLHLDATQRVDVGDVLSEGERRAVALAFFLAEIAVAEHRGGIVLDDPVSSLDHTRRAYVARRLVEEASQRQTIAFTHDIVFLLELQDQALKQKRPCEVRVVRRVGDATGIASKDLPWVAQNTKARIGYLRNEIQKLGALERKGDAEVYRRETKTWFEMLREAWERAVEEKLFAGVVGRFQPGIETLKLKTVQVTQEMTAAVERGMTQASAWTHDQAPALGTPPPTASDLGSALDELETFVTQFKR